MDNRKNVYCVIMAGGIGSRFWPLSRANKPKQFLDILGTGSSLIRQTFYRMLKVCDKENIFVVTGANFQKQVLEHIPEISPNQVLLEPMRRNTAPCIAFANTKIQSINKDAVVIVVPSDHLILEQDKFVETINSAIQFASENAALLTIGIKPTRPETGYGYIQTSIRAEGYGKNLYKVKTFTEKPNLELAKVFIETGEFFWNSGIFVWSVNSIIDAFTQHLPDIQNSFNEIISYLGTSDEASKIERVYSECRNISVDYGILEKASNVYVICSEFGWSDLGTWGSLYQNSPKDTNGNAIASSNVITYDVKNSIINVPSDKLVIVQGLEDYIVVESENILLICKKSDEQEIKRFQNDVLLEKGEDFV